MEEGTKHTLTLLAVVIVGVLIAGFVAGYINEANTTPSSS